MIGFLVLLFPLLLMLFMLGMERLEAPLTRVASERDVEEFLEHANSAELDTFVREGTDSALARFRARLRIRPSAARRRRREARRQPLLATVERRESEQSH